MCKARLAESKIGDPPRNTASADDASHQTSSADDVHELAEVITGMKSPRHGNEKPVEAAAARGSIWWLAQ